MNESFQHPTAVVETDRIGPRTRIWAFAHILEGAIIGPDCNIGDHAFVESGAEIGQGVTIKNHVLIWKGVHLADYVFVGPGAVFTNDLRPRSPRLPILRDAGYSEKDWLVETWVAEGATIGANATIIAGIRIGAFAMVGAGSVVTRDVSPYTLVVGNPARRRGWVNEQGRVLQPMGTLLRDPSSGRSYRIVEDRPIECIP